MSKAIVFCAALLAAVCLVPALATAQHLSGVITAEEGSWELGAWRYTLHIVWDTESQYGLSHVDLIVDDGEHCACEELGDAIVWDTEPGWMSGEEDDCLIGLERELICMGDPSIDVWAPLFKLEPNESPECHAGPVGELEVAFYSDYPPGPIAEPNLFLVDKYSRYSDFGMVTGVFPALPCDPVKTDEVPLDGAKAMYH